MHVLERGDRWFERRVKEAIYVKLEKLSLKRRRPQTSTVWQI